MSDGLPGKTESTRWSGANGQMALTGQSSVLAPMLWGLSDVYTSTFVGWSSVHKFAESSSICDPHVLASRVLSGMHNIAINRLSSAFDLADGSPICNLGV